MAALVGLLLLNLMRTLWCDALLRSHQSCIALRCDGDVVKLELRDGKAVSVTLASESLVTPWLVLLVVVPEGGAGEHRLLILPDSLDAESFRQLRVWLRWGSSVTA